MNSSSHPAVVSDIPRKSGLPDIVDVAFKSRWWILAGTSVGFGLGMLAYLYAGPSYETKAKILVSKRGHIEIKEDGPGARTYGERGEHVTLIMSPLIVAKQFATSASTNCRPWPLRPTRPRISSSPSKPVERPDRTCRSSTSSNSPTRPPRGGKVPKSSRASSKPTRSTSRNPSPKAPRKRSRKWTRAAAIWNANCATPKPANRSSVPRPRCTGGMPPAPKDNRATRPTSIRNVCWPWSKPAGKNSSAARRSARNWRPSKKVSRTKSRRSHSNCSCGVTWPRTETTSRPSRIRRTAKRISTRARRCSNPASLR